MVIGIYHKDCIDGTTAAAVLLNKFPDAILYPLRPSYQPKDLEPLQARFGDNADIYILDGSFGVPELVSAGMKVTVIDHHISSKDNLEKLARDTDHFTYLFNNEKSGASLAWSYFFPDLPLPRIIELVEDQDLWILKYGEETKFVNNYLSTLRNIPEKVIPLFAGITEEITQQGMGISRVVDMLIEDFLIDARPVYLKIDAHVVPSYNAVDFKSRLGNTLAIRHNAAVCMFAIVGASVRCSFRSLDDNIPSSLDLAAALGGGGHIKASGATIPLPEFLKLLLPEE